MKSSNSSGLPLENIPPQNVEAEFAVLGSMLLSSDAIAQVIEILDKKYFYKDTHQMIFQIRIRILKTLIIGRLMKL